MVVDDIQWMDEMSLSILTNLLLQYGRDKVLFVGLSRSGASNKVRRMKATLLRGGNVDVVYLSRFSKADIKGFLETIEPGLNDDQILKNIFEQTEGNPFFIKEYVYALKKSEDVNMTPAMRSIIEGRFNDLSEEASKLLDLVACFTDKIEFGALGQSVERMIWSFLKVWKNFRTAIYSLKGRKRDSLSSPTTSCVNIYMTI